MDEYPLKWITPDLAVGYAPRSESHLKSIHDAGIQAIVNLCAECYDLHDAQSAAGFDVYYLPIADEAAPGMDALEKVIEWISQRHLSGQSVLVHCRYGIGRTGTVVLAYLIHSGHGFQAARKLLAPTPSWPSNRGQKDLIDQYMARLHGRLAKKIFSKTPAPSGNTFFARVKTALKWHD